MNITDANITEEKLYLFNQGQYFHSYRVFGAHPVEGGRAVYGVVPGGQIRGRDWIV